MKKIKKSGMNHRGALAVSQIFILVIGIIAISYAVGSEARIVSAYAGDAVDEDCQFEYEGNTYIVIDPQNPNQLRDDRGILYRPSNGGWQWYSNNQGKWVDIDGQPTFENFANLVLVTCLKEESEKAIPSLTDEELADLNEQSAANLPVDYTRILGVIPEGEDETPTEPSAEEPEIDTSLTMAAAWNSLKGIAIGAGIALGIYHGVKWVLPEIFGADEDITDAAALALGWGYFAGHSSVALLGEGGLLAIEGFTALGGVAIGAGVALLVFFLQKKATQEIVVFTCQPWDADAGGDQCDKCNNQGILPCSEYQCRSLGQACELVNKGTDEEKCVWIDRNDVEFPTIEAWEDALLNDLYRYNKQTTGISPPDSGVKIEYIGEGAGDDMCVPAFTPLAFGIKTNEPAKCKLDLLRRDSFENMDFYFSGGLLNTEHSYALSLPSLDALNAEGIEIENDGEYGVYVRCQDANGNSNTANFVFNFCVDKGPDTTPPLILGTSPLNEYPIAFGQTSFITEVYVNEPAECRWSPIDQNYNDMQTMDCTNAKKFTDMNEQGLYTCIADLTGLKDRQENKFYFRCKDQPGESDDSKRNVNVESYKFSLIGTQPLVIDSVGPDGIIKDSTDTIKVTLEATTSAGHNQGEATCWYKEAGETEDKYIMFFETNSYKHSQELYLSEDSYSYSIKCVDLGGNSDTANVSFSIETDADAPLVVRAYREEDYLKLITDEPAECVYDVRYENLPCDYDFEDGIKMTTLDDVNHYTDWNTQTNLYIQCRDEYGKQPDWGTCSIIIRPFEIY